MFVKEIINSEFVTWSKWSLSGFLFFGAFLYLWSSWLVVPAAALYIWSVVSSSNLKEVAIGSWMVGTIKVAGGIVWMLNLYPLHWLGLEGSLLQIAAVSWYWIVPSMAMGLAWVPAGVGLNFLARKYVLGILSAPLLLVFGEVLGSLFISAYLLGPGTTLNVDFTFGYIGYPFSDLPYMVALAQWGGVYALSFMCGVSGLWLYLVVLRSVQNALTMVFSGMLITVYTFSWFYFISAAAPALETEKVPSNVVGVQTYLSADLIAMGSGKNVRRQVVREAVNAALTLSPDTIVLPEMSDFLSSFDSTDEALRYLRERGDAVVVDSGRGFDSSGRPVVRAVILDSAEGEAHTVIKTHLVPLGEYVPYRTMFTLSLFGKRDFIREFSRQRSFYPTDRTESTLTGELPGVLFCFSGASPFQIANIIESQDPPWIAHVVSHSWFHGSFLLSRHLEQALRIEAVHRGVPILEAGNMSGHGVFFPDGSISRGTMRAAGDYWSVYEYEL